MIYIISCAFLKYIVCIFLNYVIDCMFLGTKLSEHTTTIEFSLSLMPYSLLLQTTHLIPENVLFDAADIIPGLVSDAMDVVNSK